jgi:hypothetical protein
MAHIGGSASAEIDAPIDEVWRTVEDVLTAPDWQGALWRCPPWSARPMNARCW